MANTNNTKVKKVDIKTIHEQLIKHKEALCLAAETLNDVFYGSVSLLKILNCNGDGPCIFPDAWCRTERSLDRTCDRQLVSYADLFDIRTLTEFLETGVLSKDHGQKLLNAFSRLANFLSSYEEKRQIFRRLEDERFEEFEWTSLFGTHILKELAVIQSMKLSDSGAKLAECPCGCGNPLEYGDTSMGNLNVWHGSIDLLCGGVAIDVAIESFKDPPESEMEIANVNKYQHQLIAETIAFSCTQTKRMVPLIAVDRHTVKVFLYDNEYDLLFESTEFNLFYPEKPPYITILVLWLTINYSLFGVDINTENINFFAQFKPFICDKEVSEIYKKQMHLYNCKEGQIEPKSLKDEAFKFKGLLGMVSNPLA